MSRSRKWCFTLNNYTNEDIKAVNEMKCRYIIVGKEIGESGTPHLQGYVEYDNAIRMGTLKAIIPRAHLDVARGNSIENKNYCSKDGDILREDGERSLTQAEKGDSEAKRWKDAWEGAKKGEWDLIPDDIKIRYYNGLKAIGKDHMPKALDNETIDARWYVGPPGTGKSHAARQHGEFYAKMCNKWWDGYQDEDIILMDDLDSAHLGHHLKIWADKYGFIAETKGGARHIRPKIIIVTSNYTIDELWGYGSKEPNIAMCEALKRRFVVTRFTHVWRG